MTIYVRRISSAGPGPSTLRVNPQLPLSQVSSANMDLERRRQDYQSRKPALPGTSSSTGDTSPSKESVPPQTYPTEEELLEKEFAASKPAELLKERDRVKDHLNELTREPFHTWYEAGRYDVIGHGKTYSYDEATWSHADVSTVIMGGDTNGEIRKVTLPEYEFPEFYVMKREILWLEKRAEVLQNQSQARAR